MAITITQEIDWLSKSILPAFVSWTSDESIVYDDYRYNVSLNNTDGNLTTYSVIAQTSDLYGTIDPTQYIHSQLETSFFESGSTVSNIENQIGCYQLEITPYNYGANEPGNTETTNTFFISKSSNDSLTKIYDGSLIVDHPTKKLTLDSYFSNQSYYGKFSPYLQDYQIRFDRIIYQITKPEGYIIEIELSHSYTYRSMTYLDDFLDTSDMMLKIPAGPQNVSDILDNATNITITLPNGFVYYGMTPSDFSLENNDTYRYATFYGSTQVSNWYDIEIENCKTRYTPTQLYFLNDNGGYDSFIFYAKSEEYIKNKQEIHNRNPYHRVGDTTIQQANNIGLSVYFDNIEDHIVLNSDWLSDDEVQELRELWISPEAYIYYNNEYRSVIQTEIENVIYNKKNIGLSRYVVKLQFAKKRYRTR